MKTIGPAVAMVEAFLEIVRAAMAEGVSFGVALGSNLSFNLPQMFCNLSQSPLHL
jgi:hypothetical protein